MTNPEVEPCALCRQEPEESEGRFYDRCSDQCPLRMAQAIATGHDYHCELEPHEWNTLQRRITAELQGAFEEGQASVNDFGEPTQDFDDWQKQRG